MIRRKFASVIAAIMLALAVVLAGVIPVEAGDWRTYKDPAPFPAFVESLTFPSGYSITASSTMRWGN